jgi:hypothetical protein
MASPLALAAGASEGLDQMVAKMLAQAKLEQEARKIDEESRHNKAVETLGGRQADLLSQYRSDTLAEKERDNIRTNMEALGIGSPVQPEEYTRAIKAGYPSGNLDKTIGSTVLSGFSSAPGSVSSLTDQGAAPAPPAGKLNMRTNPDTITNLGTEAQRLARDKELQGNVNTQNETVSIEDEGLAKSLGLQVGDPIDVDRNPRTNRKIFRGQDVTDKVGHYDKPPSMLLAPLQTGTGYNVFDRRTGETRPMVQGGTQVPLPVTGSTRTMMEGAQMLQPHIDKIQTLAESLDQRHLFGPVMSRIRQHLVKAGTIDEFTQLVSNDPELAADRDAGRFATSLALLASGAGRVHGGARGGGSPQMYQAFKDALSDTSTLNMFEGRLDGLNEYMSGYAAGPTAAGGAAQKPGAVTTPAPAGGTDAYQEYLKRTAPK